MDHPKIAWSKAEAIIVARLRKMAMAYPEAVETENFGHPWFRAGKRPFCIPGQDKETGALDVSFSTSKMDQETLCQSAPCFRPTAYMHQHGWTTYVVDAEPDWDLVADLMEGAYRNVALKRMLKALDST